MQHFLLNDTICALSTAPGTGAIAVIRLSGPAAFTTISQIFTPAEKGLDLATVNSHTIHFGTIRDESSLVDEVLVSVFKAPHSYTGEDVIEISCHGSPFIQQKIIALLISLGLRLAKPGEFTFRAFINKKFDLSQAEAVADLIASASNTSHGLALEQMRGGYSKKISALRQSLIEFTALIELELDFSEEHMIFADRADLRALLDHIAQELSLLIDSFSLGNVIKNGIPVAIVGKPNVGKSTLLNAILNEERAIVSEIPGTTRDAIEDTIVIGGYRFRFIDTAGLRASEELIETIGIERTWQKIGEASIILYVFDVSVQTFEEVKEAIEELAAGSSQGSDISTSAHQPISTLSHQHINTSPHQPISTSAHQHIVLVGNKTDKLKRLPKHFSEFVDYETIFVSGKRKENIHLLAEHLVEVVEKTKATDKTIVSNSRHYEALRRALEAIQNVRSGLAEGISPDLFTIDIRQALYHLGEITGEITTDEILGSVFSRFCVGK